MTADDSQAYWDRQPCNSRHSKLEPGTRAYFLEVAARKRYAEPHVPAFASFQEWRGKRVLEIGCGLGVDAVSFCDAGAIYTGVDFSPRTCALARSHLREMDAVGEILQLNVERDPLPSGRWDLVYSFGVLHHLRDPLAVLLKARHARELRFMVYAERSWKAAMIDAGLDRYEAQPGVPIARRYTREGAAALAERSGYKPYFVEQDHIFRFDGEAWGQGRAELLPWWTAMSDATQRAMTQQLGWHLLVKAVRA